MHRFKHAPGFTNQYKPEAYSSNANGPSAHPSSTRTLQYINLLDKCTQILREDRIWLRNLVKANEEDVISIFVASRKPINMQHLQIRLRKYVTLVKSKAKTEQLAKFKENLAHGTAGNSTTHKYDSKVETGKSCFNTTMQIREEHHHSLSQQPRLNSGAKQSGYNRESHQKMFGSKSPTYENFRSHSSHSLNKKEQSARQPVEQYNKPKNSQNVSSKSQSQQIYPYKTANSSSSLQKTFGHKNRSNDYPTIEQLSERQEMNSGRGNFNFAGMNNQVHEHPVAQRQMQYDNLCSHRRQQPEDHYEEQVEYRHEDDEEESEEEERQSNHHHNLHTGHLQFNPPVLSNPLVQNTFSLNVQSPTVQLPLADSNNLFTSPELLMECRRFLNTHQQKSASANKSSDAKGIEVSCGDRFKGQLLNFDHSAQSKQRGSANRSREEQKNSTSKHSIEDSDVYYQENGEVSRASELSSFNRMEGNSTGGKKEQAGSFGKEPRQSPNQSHEQDIYTYSDTFNAPSYQEEYLEQCSDAYRKDQPVQESDQYQHGIEYRLDQQELSQVMASERSNPVSHQEATYEFFKKVADPEQSKHQEAYQPIGKANPFFDRIDLDGLNSEKTAEELMDLLIPYVSEDLIVTEKEMMGALPHKYAAEVRKGLSPMLSGAVSIVDAGNLFFSVCKSSKPGANQVRDIYSLLDISQKGYITVEGIDGFLEQLKEAEVECWEDLAQKLNRVYEHCQIDHKVYYWALYSLKDSQEFTDICEMLEQFEFEIEDES